MSLDEYGDVAYVPLEEWESGDAIGYHQTSYGPFSQSPGRDKVKIIVPKYMSGSDYSGSLVERSNVAVFLKDFADHPDVRETVGGHGTFGVLIRADSTDKELEKVLEALDGYPLLDEDHHSHLQIEAESEAWDSWGKHDFKKELEKQWGNEDEDLFDDLTDDQLFELFREGADRAYEYWENESADNMTINMKRVVDKGVRQEDLEKLGFEFE